METQETIILDLIRKNLRNEKKNLNELEIEDIAKKALKASGQSTIPSRGGSIYIPLSLRTESDDYWAGRNKRDILTEAYLIGAKRQYIINPLNDVSVFGLAGARFMDVEHEDFKSASFSGIFGSWVNDGEEPDSDGDDLAAAGATYSGKRIYVCLDIPMKAIALGGLETENILKDGIRGAVAAILDSTIGGATASSTKKPQGMGFATGLNSVSINPVYNDILALEEAVNGLNVPIDKYSFITNPKGRKILRSTYRDPAGLHPVFNNGKINDYNAYISNHITGQAGSGDGNLLLFGNFSDLAAVQFGAWEILVDPFILKKLGKVQLTVNSYWDVKGLRGPAVSPAGVVNEYAHSFASIAIK